MTSLLVARALLIELERRFPAHPPRRHALMVEGQFLAVQLGLEEFYVFLIDGDEDMFIGADVLAERIGHFLDEERARLCLSCHLRPCSADCPLRFDERFAQREGEKGL